MLVFSVDENGYVNATRFSNSVRLGYGNTLYKNVARVVYSEGERAI
jgi:hypothetical protein